MFKGNFFQEEEFLYFYDTKRKFRNLLTPSGSALFIGQEVNVFFMVSLLRAVNKFSRY